jgi:hypothetical protein
MRRELLAVLVIGLIGAVLIGLDESGAWLVTALVLFGISVTAALRSSRTRR